MISVQSLTQDEAKELINQLVELDDKIQFKTDYVMQATNSTLQDALEYVINDSPALWAKVYLNWSSRDYQCTILLQGRKKKKIVLRLGRRLGKTECMCILILWYAYTQINRGDNNQYDILIVTPYETQIDLIFKRLHELIDSSELMQDMIDRDVYHHIELKNGTNITGLTAGSKNGSGGANTRGQHANILILDECDYMTSADITNIINITNDDPEHCKIIASSTPCGKHEEFYKWCTGASHKFYPNPEDIKKFEFHGFECQETKGNGWTEVFAPSTVNKNLLNVNPDTEQTYIEDLKDELSEMRFLQEVMAEFGEEDMGVYLKKFIQMAVDEGKRTNHKYIGDMSDDERTIFKKKRRTGPRILGIDWDKYKAGTSFVMIELDKLFVNAQGVLEPKFKVILREEIPRSEFTYTNAIDRVIAINEEYNPDWIAVDRGYGEVQVELLKKYGLANPDSGLDNKVEGYQFSEKVEVRDPYTQQMDKKPIKPLMVNESVVLFEKGKIVISPNDKVLIEELEKYKVESISQAGLPIFSSEDEHFIDAMNLAILSFKLHYDGLFRQITSTKIAVLSGNVLTGDEEKRVKVRDLENKEDTSKVIAIPRYNNKTVYVVPSKNQVKKRYNISKRVTF